MNYKIIIMVLLLLNSACSTKKNEKAEAVKKKYKIRPLELIDVDSPVKLLGSVAAFRKAEVSSKVLGRVEKILKEEGEKVDIKSPLAKIETLNLELQLKKDMASLEVQNKQIQLSNAKYLQAKQRVERDYSAIEKAKADVQDTEARYHNLERVYDNKKKLAEEGAVSETELKAVETELVSTKTNYFKAQKSLENQMVGYRPEDLKKAGIAIPNDISKLKDSFVDLNTIVERAELDIAKANLQSIQASIESTNLLIKESTILSPIKGVVATRNIFPGESVKEQQPLFAIVDDSEILLKYSVSESDISRIKIGQKVQFSVDAYPDKFFTGTVVIISPLVDPQSRTLELKVLYKQTDGKLKPGMFSRGEIMNSNTERLFFLPAGSVMNKDDKESSYIFVANTQNMLFKRKININKIENDIVYFSGEIREGELVAEGEIHEIKEGEQIKIPDNKSNQKQNFH